MKNDNVNQIPHVIVQKPLNPLLLWRLTTLASVNVRIFVFYLVIMCFNNWQFFDTNFHVKPNKLTTGSGCGNIICKFRWVQNLYCRYYNESRVYPFHYEYILFICNGSSWSNSYDACLDSTRPGFNPHWGTILLTHCCRQCELWARSGFKKHEDMLFPWRGECNSVLVVWQL